MENANSDDWNSDYAKYLMAEKITDYDSKTLEELSVPILTKEEFEQKQIEKMQEAISEKARELWNDALSNIDGTVYSNKWEYLDYLEEIRFRRVSTLTLQQVKEPILSFWEFNERIEQESAMPVESVDSVQNVGVKEKTEEPMVKEVADIESAIERPLTIEERAREISRMIRNNYGRYDKVPVKVKAELFQFFIDDLQTDMKLHSLVLKELNVKMYSSELYDDYMSIVDVTDEKQSDETRNVNCFSSEKRWNRSR